MRLISSQQTFISKRVFPVMWFGFLVFFMVMASRSGNGRQFQVQFVIAPLFMAVMGFFIMKRLGIFDLADQVWDAGDELLVRNHGIEDRIALTNIINVNYTNSRPSRVTLMLREACAFGKEVSFMPPARFLSFSTHPIVTELIQRIDEKRG